MLPLGLLPSFSPPEMIVVGIVAVLLFGKRLPEVGRSLGKGLIEFKKGLRGAEEEFLGKSSSVSAYSTKSQESYKPSDDPATSVPKFEPPALPPAPKTEFEPQAYSD